MRRVAIVPVVIVTALLALGGPASAGEMSATAKPAKHLAADQTVTVSWKGFRVAPMRNGGQIRVLTCTPSWVSEGISACYNNPNYTAGANPSARGSFQVKVYKGVVPNAGSCGTSSADNDCVLLVFGTDKHDRTIAVDEAAAPITFALH
jgi:hypothetical protein